jgi:hypothetical protein
MADYNGEGTPDPEDLETVYQVSAGSGSSRKLHARPDCQYVRGYGATEKPGDVYPPNYDYCKNCWPGVEPEPGQAADAVADGGKTFAQMVMDLQDEHRD